MFVPEFGHWFDPFHQLFISSNIDLHVYMSRIRIDLAIRITCPWRVYPLNPTFIIIVVLGYTGAYHFSHFDPKIDCVHTLEPPRQSMF